MDLTSIRHIHFTGIKGVGMAALACIAKDFGMHVSGSDVEGTFVTDPILEQKQIECQIGFRLGSEIKPDLLVYTAAHKAEENPEVLEAIRTGIPTLTFGEALGLFFNSKSVGISVTGVGGKTTTSAMLATVLETAGKHPSYMVGVGSIPSLPFPGAYDQNGDIFVSEADEYACSPRNKYPKFRYQNPKIIILTNLAFDHPDIYPNEEATLETFKAFIQRLPTDGLLIANKDSELVRRLLPELTVPVVTYGFDPTADWQLLNYRVEKQIALFELKYEAESNKKIRVKIPGKFNAANGVATYLAARQLGLSDEIIQVGLDHFMGTERRFQHVAQVGSTELYDDYAHHPQEIQSTLAAAREWFPGKKIVVLFQPHTYSRTKALFQEFAQSFDQADTVILTDIFASAREPFDPRITSEMLVEAIRTENTKNTESTGTKKHGDITDSKLQITDKEEQSVYFCSGEIETLEQLQNMDLNNSVIFTMGAGDVYQWHDSIVKLLSN